MIPTLVIAGNDNAGADKAVIGIAGARTWIFQGAGGAFLLTKEICLPGVVVPVVIGSQNVGAPMPTSRTVRPTKAERRAHLSVV